MDAKTQDVTTQQPGVVQPTEQGEVILRGGQTATISTPDRAALEAQKANALKILDNAMAQRNVKPVQEVDDAPVEIETEIPSEEVKAEEKKAGVKPGELTDEDFKNMDPKVADRFRKMYGKIKNQEREFEEAKGWADKVAKKNEQLEKEMNNLKIGQLQAEITSEKARIDILTKDAIAANSAGDYTKGAELLREVSRLEARLEVKNKDVQPIQEAPRQLSPKQTIWLQEQTKRTGSVWEPTHNLFQQACAELDAMFKDPKNSEWGIKQLVRYVENKYTPGQVAATTETEEGKPEVKPTEKKFAQAVLGQSQGTTPRPTQTTTVQLSDQQKQVARKLFSGIAPAEAYKRYARGLQ